MIKLLFRRVLLAIPVIAAAALFTFVIARLLPGDPAVQLASGMNATPEGLAGIRHRLGLDASLLTQLGRYLVALAHGDWGVSFATGQPVLAEIQARLPASLELMFCGFVLTLIAGLPMGIAAARHPGRWPDHVCRVFSSAGASLPSFFVGLALIYLFYFRLGWAVEPSGRFDPLLTAPPVHTGFLLIDAALDRNASAWLDAAKRLVLPACTMAIFGIAPLARITRSAMLDALTGEPVRTARSLGLSERTVLFRYALPQAAPAIITASGMILSYMLGANVAVEKIFAWPGVGAYALDALSASDYAPLQGFILCVAIVFAALNLVVDLVLAVFDPRTRHLR
jgi:peptide/nickel transport system permease protein